MQVVIVGAGVIGALSALRLAQAGAKVTVVEAGRPAGAASGASFGWINASFHADAHHFALRHAAMAAHRRVIDDLGTEAIDWPGCLCWEAEGAALEAQHDALHALGYDVRMVAREQFVRLEPMVANPPEAALLFAGEGVVDLAALTHDALRAATELGVRLITGVPVTGIATDDAGVRGVVTAQGIVPGRSVLIAGGTGTTALLAPLGVVLPMLTRPGLMLRTRPVIPVIDHVLVTPHQELRQDETGRILAPTASAHQSDDAEEVTETPDALADRALARLRALLPGVTLDWAEVSLALRPVPGDGLPVIGACGPEGLYVSTMHSGATLAPLVAELARQEVMGGTLSTANAALLAPYRPDRFQSASS